ncbi:ABC transporter ATP-binding protein [Neorhizobium sp. DT-125]|uniref:ABC transporter ATP-binding protein n=1 Tax=Neorhizobium sp. DT-125 TaxID=3396163 RepID=UPI003F1AA7CD
MITSQPLVRIENVTKIYNTGGILNSRPVPVVNDVSLDIGRGEIVGLVGESGSGKSTLGRMVLRLETLSGGKLSFDGQDITNATRSEMKPLRKSMQVVFQDPYAALSPRMRAGDFVAEPLRLHGLSGRLEREQRVAELFSTVGLDPTLMKRFPHEFSGGQRQRVCIARAIASEPSFIVADEPITALDVSIQAQIVNLFKELQQRMGLSYLFIAHDLSMVRYLCDRVAVMLRGRIVEIGPAASVFNNPLHAYTQALLSAVPVPDPDTERTRQRLLYDPAQHPPGERLEEKTPGHFLLV